MDYNYIINMNIPYPLLLEIYDYILMVNKRKLIKSYNEEYLDVVLKQDIVTRYKLWLFEGKPILLYILWRCSEQTVVQLINTFEELGQPQYISEFGDAAIKLMINYKMEFA